MSYAEISNRIRYRLKSKFMRNVAILASGTAGAQIITMVFSPVITRIYGPEVFGLLGTFMAFVAVLSPISALCYSIAIVLPLEDSDAKGIAQLSIYISFTLAFLIMIVLILYGNWLFYFVGAKAIAPFVILIPLNMLFDAWVQIAQQWLIRNKHFHITAKVGIVQALVTNSTKAGIGWFYPMATVLIILTTISSACNAVLLYFGIFRTKQEKSRAGKSQARTPLFELARRYYDFPLYRTPQVFINAVSQSLPILMLTAFFGPASAGFYAICKRVLGMPSHLIGQSVGQVFYPRISEAAHKGENLTPLLLKATLSLAAIGFLPFLIVIVFGPWLFELVFGAEWTIAGVYARWLSFMFFFHFVNSPAVAAIPVLGLQKGFIIYELFSTGAKLLAMYIGFFQFNSDKIAVAIFSLSGAVSYLILVAWVIICSRFYTTGMRREYS